MSCRHRWTVIHPDVLRIAQRWRLPYPTWYGGRAVPPYCRDCGTPKAREAGETPHGTVESR